MVINCYMVYRRNADNSISEMVVTVDETQAKRHADGLNKSAKTFNMNCTYFYDKYKLEIDENKLVEVERKELLKYAE